MPGILQEFIAKGTQKAADDLAASFGQLPEDKRAWEPEGKARSAADQVAECAILNGYTAHVIETQQFPIGSFDVFFQEKARVAALGWEGIQALLQENTQKVVKAIRAAPDESLTLEVYLPWGKQTIGDILAYPQWNMAYHQGQINYIAAMLGCQK